MIYSYPNGKLCPHPIDKLTAINHKSNLYDDNIKCKNCTESSLKFTKTDNCIVCQRYKATIIAAILSNGLESVIHYIDDKPCFVFFDSWQTMPDGWLDEIRACVETVQSGKGVFYGEPCEKAGHIGIRNKDNKCLYCAAVMSPRKAALEAGERHYMPDMPCGKCGAIARRRVDNGACEGCKPGQAGQDRRTTPSSILMRDCPDLIISRSDARSAGFKVYRTGKACLNGHTGYRRLSTGGCLEC